MDSSPPLGVGLTPLETRREVVLHVASRAEQLGYAAIYLAEGWGHDAAVLLAEVAVRTSRIRIGSGVLNVWGRSPATIAMLATSLHEVSAGRFVLGLGAGSPRLAEGLHDVAFDARWPAWVRSCGRSAGCSTVSGSLFPRPGNTGRCAFLPGRRRAFRSISLRSDRPRCGWPGS